MQKKNIEGLLDELDAQVFCFQGESISILTYVEQS